MTCLGFALVARVSHAQGEAAPERLEQAKEQFRSGVARLNAGDTAGALSDFLRSRELRASGKNTVNAAICLERLERYDEALDLYEEVLARFASDLEPEDRENLMPVMAALRAKLSYVELSANVPGDVTLAGRTRGQLPFETALRMLPGRATIRIVKDGYRPYESTLELVAGQTKRLNAQLEPLSAGPTPAPTTSAEVVSATQAAPAPQRSSTRRTLAWTLSGAGVAQLGLAGYFGLRAIQLNDDGSYSQAGTAADTATVLSITGLATTAVGIYLFLTSKPSTTSSSTRGTIYVSLTNSSTLGLAGTF